MWQVPLFSTQDVEALCYFVEGDLVGYSDEEIRSREIAMTATAGGENQDPPSRPVAILYEFLRTVSPTTERGLVVSIGVWAEMKVLEVLGSRQETPRAHCRLQGIEHRLCPRDVPPLHLATVLFSESL